MLSLEFRHRWWGKFWFSWVRRIARCYLWRDIQPRKLLKTDKSDLIFLLFPQCFSTLRGHGAFFARHNSHFCESTSAFEFVWRGFKLIIHEIFMFLLRISQTLETAQFAKYKTTIDQNIREISEIASSTHRFQSRLNLWNHRSLPSLVRNYFLALKLAQKHWKP